MSGDETPVRLPKKALERVHLGQSFAEYDTTLRHADIFVHTPALEAASDFQNPHCFFVGRRGTGKTTITKYIDATQPNVIVIRPEIFSPNPSLFSEEDLREANQRPFRSLISAFRRSLQHEVILAWRAAGKLDGSSGRPLTHEVESVGEPDFDLRTLKFIEELMVPLSNGAEVDWVSRIKAPKIIAKEMELVHAGASRGYSILLDAIDESWDGSELAVIYLAALMHACLEINSHPVGARVLIFLRENIFERVRVIDTEFSRLETCVVGLDWTTEQLLEMVERRLNAPLTAKLPLGGKTWDAFFEGENSRSKVFDLCQSRPRDVLTYTALALGNAQSHKHDRIMIEDLQDARRRFSTSRLSDLGDEYQENYPQLSLVLSRFYGLGQRWTLVGVRSMLARLLDDEQVKVACARWIFSHTNPEQFARLMYDIGFFGFKTNRRDGTTRTVFRSLGPRDTTPPPISSETDMVVHPSYWDALDLQDVLVREFETTDDFRTVGLITELPGALSLYDYNAALANLYDRLKNLPTGLGSASEFEDIVGDVLRLCFFRVLSNVESQAREIDGVVRRDWIASNRGESGFWEMVRHRYGATQVLFECKNYAQLKAGDFQQCAYYMTGEAGKLVFVAFRGEIEKHYFQHIRRIASQSDGLVVPLTEKDLLVFIRQAMNGKVKESHLQERLDRIQRAIS